MGKKIDAVVTIVSIIMSPFLRIVRCKSSCCSCESESDPNREEEIEKSNELETTL